MDLIIHLVVGAVIGWLAGVVMKTEGQTGLVGNILIGLVGAALGHFLAPMIGVGATNQLGSILVSVGGAAVLIVILKALKVLK